MKTSYIVGLGILAVIVIIGLGWLGLGNQYAQNKVFAPANEAVRRETFEQSHAYNAGTVAQLRNAQREYIQVDPSRRAGLTSVIIQQAADYPDEALPADLRAFMTCLRQHQTDGFDCSPGVGQ